MAEPRYRQIADDLRGKIESGELDPERPLPTEMELREIYGVSRNTVREAIRMLIMRGLVETRPGQGTFVTRPIEPFVTTLGDPFRGDPEEAVDKTAGAVAAGPTIFTAPRLEVSSADGPIAGELQLTEGTTVVSRHQQCFIDDTPRSLQTSFYPMSLVERGATSLIQASDIPEGVALYLAKTVGIKQAGIRDTIAVRSPDQNEAWFFKLPADGRVPLIEIHRVSYDQNGQPFGLTVTVYPADRNTFVLTSAAGAAGHGEQAGRGEDTGQPAYAGDRQGTPARQAAASAGAARSVAEILASLDPDTRYFLSRAHRSGPGELSWLFEGRAAEREQIATWLRSARSGVLVVTGRAGAGKSALLADVLARSVPDLRDALIGDGLVGAVPSQETPPDEVFDAVLHLGGLTVPQITGRLASAVAEGLNRRQPGAAVAAGAATDLEEKAAQLAAAAGAFTLLADGLDKAADPLGTVRSVLGRLTAIPGVRILIGTRASTSEHLDAPVEDQNILDALGAGRDVLRLARDPDSAYGYSRRYLRVARQQQADRDAAAGMALIPDAELDRVAAAIAERDGQEFLFTRLAVHEVTEDPRLLAPALASSLSVLLDGGYQSLFAAAVDRLVAQDDRYTALLQTLAQAHDQGLSESDWIWAALAAAPRGGRAQAPAAARAVPSPTAADLAWTQSVRALLDQAAPYIAVDSRTGDTGGPAPQQAGPAGDGAPETVYRLVHRVFAQFLGVRDTEHDQQQLPAFDHATSVDLESYVREFAGAPPALEAALQEGRLPCSPSLASRSPGLARLTMHLWRLTSVHSGLHQRLLDGIASDSQPSGLPLADQREVPVTKPAPRPGRAAPPRSPPQQKGALLEKSVVDVLERLFQVDSDDARRLRARTRRPAQIRQQRSGTQYGADVVVRRTAQQLLRRGISFRAAAKSAHSTCLVECKNYTSPVTMATVSDKLLQAEMSFRDEPVDHWILISPHEDPNNELDVSIQHWNSTRRFPFTVQVWSPQTGVKDLFALMPEVYLDLYGKDPRPPRRDPDSVVADFAARLAPMVRLPEKLADYIEDPRSFVRPHEKAWLDQIDSQVARFGFDEKGARLPRPLRDEILSALCGPPGGSDVALLLAEFGEGKSFFTVSLCAYLRARYLAEPGPGSPIPVRLLLQGFQHTSSATDFLRTQLERTGLTMQDWAELRREEVLVILDGLDEISVRQDPDTTRANLEKIESLLGELEGLPVLVTSRPHFLSAAYERERFYDRLRRPRVFRMGQPDRRDIVAHLRAFADTPALAEKLDKIKELYDPIALASKMLFLEMTKNTLPYLPEDRFDEVTLYEVYVTKSLERKIELLRDPDSALLDRELHQQLLELLEKIAVAIHVSGEGCVDLRDFTAEAGGPARLLWKAAQADELPAGRDEDAMARIGTRSLLRRVAEGPDQGAGEGWLVDFFHRSMKEYFVAKALERALQQPDSFGATRKLLRQAPVQPEILGFFRLLAGHVSGATDVLARVARSARTNSKFPLAGGGAISLYAAAGGRMRGDDWRSLNLDGALLAGADLADSDLRGSTLRGADLSSADLTDADLRDCDLTEANLAAGGSIVAMSPDAVPRHYICLTSESGLGRIAVKADGSLTYTFIRLPRPVQSPQGLFALEEGLILVAGRSELMITRVEGGIAEEMTRFRISAQLRAVAVIDQSFLGLLVEPESGHSEALLTGIADGQVAWRLPVEPRGQACGWGTDGVTITYESGIRAYRADGSESFSELSLRWSGRSLSVHKDTAVAVTSDGQVAWLRIGSPEVVSVEAHHGAGTAVAGADGKVLSAGADGAIVLSRRDGDGLPVVVSRLERHLRCSGAKVGGLRRERERLAFLANGAHGGE